MKLLIDTHTHTVASGHAYSTVVENVKCAKEKGLKMIAITDHGPSMSGGAHRYHFSNLKVIPRVLWGVEILRGVEANIMDYSGTIDLQEKRLKDMDLVIASLHESCIKPGTREENTRAFLGAMDNPYVDIIGHPGNPVYEIDVDAVIKKAKERNILIEINNSSFSVSRPGSSENCYRIAAKAKEAGVPIVVGSDAHICFDVGRFEKAQELIETIGIPEELIMNVSVEKFKNYLYSKGKVLGGKHTIPEV